ncbi:MAG: phosphoribosyl-AMP cyclohydrolase [Candidatus Thermoplasmatota archaeon]|nr:phosphoribosyl-AMP cyclohydrolase [Candidatus Thermoplasmatota archaeon]
MSGEVQLVTVADVEEAQQAWGEGIVAIASAHNAGADYIQRAKEHIRSLYAYEIAPVLFKPTFASRKQFRSTFEGALSYFVAGNNVCPEDEGFAIKGWTNVRFENEGIIINGTTAMAMGNYFFTTPKGDEVKVEFSFGYIVDSNGDLRIQLHHSSMPASIE